MDIAQRFIAELEQLKVKQAEQGLTPPTELQTEFGYGKACGVQIGLKLALEAVNRCLNDNSEE